jgi:hypothetical protein
MQSIDIFYSLGDVHKSTRTILYWKAAEKGKGRSYMIKL